MNCSGSLVDMTKHIIPITDQNHYEGNLERRRTHIEVTTNKSKWSYHAYVSLMVWQESNGPCRCCSESKMLEIEPMKRRSEKRLEAILKEQIEDKGSATWTAIDSMCKEYGWEIS